MKNQQECLKLLINGKSLVNKRTDTIVKFFGGYLRKQSVGTKGWSNSVDHITFCDAHDWFILEEPKKLYAYTKIVHVVYVGGTYESTQVEYYKHELKERCLHKTFKRAPEFDMEVS